MLNRPNPGMRRRTPRPSGGFPSATLLWRPGPQDALVLRAHRGHPLVDELLDALPLVGFRGVDVALGVGGDAVHAVELPRLAAAVAEAREDFELLPVDD